LLAVVQADGTMRVERLPKRAEVLTFRGVPPFGRLDFACDGKKLAWAHKQSVFFLDLETKKLEKQFEDEKDLTYMIVSPDGKMVVTGPRYPDGSVHFWNLATKKSKTVFEEAKSKYRYQKDGRVGGLAIDPRGKTVAVGIYGGCVFVDVEKGTERAATPFYPKR